MNRREKSSLGKKYDFSENLLDEIEHSIDMLRDAEDFALSFCDKGFYLAFSGGKDSQCLYHVAKLAGVKFEAHMNMTSIDPAEVVKFVKHQYPDVIRHAPEMSFWNLIKKKKILPSVFSRYCCETLKEGGGAGTVTLTGIRAEESVKRSKRQEVEMRKRGISIPFDQFEGHKEKMVTCVKGKDKVIMSPILHWTVGQVWEFLNKMNIPHCSLYDKGKERIGCILCPMSRIGEMRSYPTEYPHQVKKLYDAVKYLKDKDKYTDFEDANEVVGWYLSKRSFKDYRRLVEKGKIKKFNINDLLTN